MYGKIEHVDSGYLDELMLKGFLFFLYHWIFDVQTTAAAFGINILSHLKSCRREKKYFSKESWGAWNGKDRSIEVKPS